VLRRIVLSIEDFEVGVEWPMKVSFTWGGPGLFFLRRPWSTNYRTWLFRPLAFDEGAECGRVDATVTPRRGNFRLTLDAMMDVTASS